MMQRPGGRSARVRDAVHQAVLALLRQQSWEELSIPAPRTLRRAPGDDLPALAEHAVLLDDVVAEHLTRSFSLPDTGSLSADLVTYAEGVARGLAGPFRALILRAAMVDIRPGGTPALAGTLAERGRQLQAMLDRARARGETPPTLDELIELVLAPLYFYALFTRPAGPPDARRLVERLLTLPTGTDEHGADDRRNRT